MQLINEILFWVKYFEYQGIPNNNFLETYGDL